MVAQFGMEPSPIAQGPGSWTLPLLSACGLAIFSVSAIVAVRRHRSLTVEALYLEEEDDAEGGIDDLSQGLVE